MKNLSNSESKSPNINVARNPASNGIINGILGVTQMVLMP